MELYYDDNMLNNKAKYLAENAMRIAENQDVNSPFAEKAKLYDFIHHGGKLDDISVIVAVIHSLF